MKTQRAWASGQFWHAIQVLRGHCPCFFFDDRVLESVKLHSVLVLDKNIEASKHETTRAPQNNDASPTTLLLLDAPRRAGEEEEEESHVCLCFVSSYDELFNVMMMWRSKEGDSLSLLERKNKITNTNERPFYFFLHFRKKSLFVRDFLFVIKMHIVFRCPSVRRPRRSRRRTNRHHLRDRRRRGERERKREWREDDERKTKKTKRSWL